MSKNKLSIFAFVIAATLAMLSSASATSISEDIAVGGTLIGTVTLTQGGTGSCTGFSSTSVWVIFQRPRVRLSDLGAAVEASRPCASTLTAVLSLAHLFRPH